MKRKKLCIVCHKNPAEVPDRERGGRPINRVCRECHRERLLNDMQQVLDADADRCLAVMAWARDKLLREVKAVEEDGEHGIYTPATMRAVANALDPNNNPRLKA